MSAVIYAAIVVMWAVVLVPMWLRRHDAATESRSVDRFSTAMRTLSRRTTSGPGRRYVVMPRRNDGGMSVHVSGAAMTERLHRRPVTARVPEPMAEPAARPTAAPRPAAARPAAGRPANGSRASIVARRRRLLLGMLAVTFLTMLLAAVGVVSWPLQIVVDVILVAFCIHLRGQARQAAAVSRQRRRATAATAAPASARPRPRTEDPQVVRPAAAVAQPTEQILAATGTEATHEPFADTDADPTWEPVPVPRPTYTLKPPAYVPPTYEVDPLRDTDPHTQVVGAEVIASEPVGADSDLDDILERRWAVND